MKTKLLIIIVFVLLGLQQTQAQHRKTKQTKVILVVNEKSATVSSMQLFANFQKVEKKDIPKKYPGSTFYIGLLEGSYELEKNTITPVEGSMVTMYTEKQFFSGNQVFLDSQFALGDLFNLGNTTAKVISKKKGALVFEIQ